MKNYLVIATRDFDDYEGLEVKSDNPKKTRVKNDEFKCTKERYEYLLKNNAVILKGIEKNTKKK